MRIDRLDINSYGHLRDCTLKFAKPPVGLTVVLGPNEAGKSTVMRALQAFLFGIDSRTADHYGAGIKTLSIRGKLRSRSGEKLTATRQGLTNRPLVTLDDEPLDEESTAGFFEFAERTLFSTLFFIGHKELSEQSEKLLATDGEIGRLVFGAGLGAVDLNQVLSDLNDRSAALFRPSASSRLINSGMRTYRDASKSAKELRVRSSRWSDLDTKLSDSERTVAELRLSRTDLLTKQSRLQRVDLALPLVARREAALQVVRSLEQSGPHHSNEWAEDVAAAIAEFAAAEAALRECSTDEASTTQRLAAVSVDQSVLDHEAAVDSVAEGIERFEELTTQRATTEAELALHLDGVSRLRERLDPQASGGELTEYTLTPVNEALIVDLATEATLLRQEEATADRELSALQKRIESFVSQLADVGTVTDIAALKQTLALAQRHGPSTADITELTTDSELARTKAEALQARLGLGSTDWSQLDRLVVPSRAEVDEERQRRADLTATTAHIRERAAEVQGTRSAVAQEQQRLAEQIDAPSRSDLEAARQRRDAGWELVEQTLLAGADVEAIKTWAGDQNLPSAFKTSMHDADGIVDRRYDHAEQLTQQVVHQERLNELDEQLVAFDVEHEVLEADAAERRAAWLATWRRVGVEGESPEAMTEWLDDYDELVRHVETHRSDQHEIEVLRARSEEHRAALSNALIDAGSQPAHTTLDGLVAQAGEHIATISALAKKRTQLETKLATEQDNLPDRLSAIAKVAQQRANWQAAWAPAVARLNLSYDVSPNGARATLDLVRQLHDAQRAASTDSDRLDGLVTSLQDYRRRVADTARLIDQGLAADEPQIAAAELRRRLKDARADKSLQDALNAQLVEIRVKVESAGQHQLVAAEELHELRLTVGLSDQEDLAATALRSKEIASARQAASQIDEQLLSIGAGKSISELLDEVEPYRADADGISAEQIDIEQSLGELEARLNEVSELVGATRGELHRIDGSSDAADREQDAENALAALGTHVEEYVRTELAAAVLAEVITDYGDRHQRPFLETATTIFGELTSGAFTDLVADSDGVRQVLLAKRANGELLGTSQLSDGTRDQLYLALRLAGVQHHLHHSDEPLPLLLDDLLVNFDEERAAAALQVLARFGANTQVLLFTHERSIATMASELLTRDECVVIELEPRRHDTPHTAPPVETPRLPFAIGTSSSDEYRDKVLACLAESAEPLGRTDILSRTGVPEREWNATIKSLVESGAAIRTGQKRGARYSTAG